MNWYGATDVDDLLAGNNRKNDALWFGSILNKEQIARELSPITYGRKGNPPMITVHGKLDDVVP